VPAGTLAIAGVVVEVEAEIVIAASVVVPVVPLVGTVVAVAAFAAATAARCRHGRILLRRQF